MNIDNKKSSDVNIIAGPGSIAWHVQFVILTCIFLEHSIFVLSCGVTMVYMCTAVVALP